MTSYSIGDLAQHFTLLRHTSSLRGNVADRVKELGSGEVADVSRHLSGDFTLLAGIERSITLNQSHASIIESARTFIIGQGLAFDKARGLLSETGVDLVDAAESVNQTRRSAVLTEAEYSFESVVAALNSQAGGRSLFAGAATQTAAFADGEDILVALEAALAAETTAADVMAVADTWFAPGGGYDTDAYLGSDDPLDGFQVAESVVVSPELYGGDDSIRDLLKYHALAAVASRGSLPLINEELSNLMRTVGTGMINLNEDMIDTRAAIGSVESRIDRIDTENAAEGYALMEARTDLVGIDPAETIMQLSELETQLQALYTVTARVSRLTLTEYL